MQQAEKKKEMLIQKLEKSPDKEKGEMPKGRNNSVGSKSGILNSSIKLELS